MTSILWWFAIPSSSGLRFFNTLCYDLSRVALHGMAHSFIELCKPLFYDKAVTCEGDHHGTSVL